MYGSKDELKKMFHSLRAALEVVYSTSDVWSGLPYVVIAATVFVCGTLVWFLFTYFLEYLLLSNQRRRQAIHIPYPGDPTLAGSKRGWAWRPWQFGENTIQFCLKTLFVVGIGFIIWISGGASGFNPWTTGAAMMVIGVLITYTLAAPLGQWGAGFGVTGSNMINVGEYWEFFGMKDYDGWITGIYSLEVEMMRFDEKKNTEIISMPLSQFLGAPRKRNLVKEMDENRPWKLVGQNHWKQADAARAATGLMKKQDSPTTARQIMGKGFYLTPELLI